jgi:beta-galactosidase/beta-glucuronidase
MVRSAFFAFRFQSLVLLTCLLLIAGVSRILAEPFWQDVNPVMRTKWTADVKPDKVLPEYPRPQMARADWLNLNGPWDYALGKKDDTTLVAAYTGKILVPFSYDSVLSGVTKMLIGDQRLWYRRTFEVPGGWKGKRVLLHFGAVSYDATVFLNGKELGAHQGDYDGFDFDITDALKADGAQELVVSVWDPVQAGIQARGKQSNGSYSIWHTGSSGIWQTVWIEPVAQASIAGLKMTPDIDKSVLKLIVSGQGTGSGDTVEAVATDGGKEIGRISGPVGSELSLPVANAKLWSPDSPFLYDLKVGLSHGGQPVDTVTSYFGMRKIAMAKDAKGVPRIWLNNKIMFQIGVLDQGYWPDGLYTAPTDDALRYDVEMCKKFGFNFNRKHVKVEPDRWYYWCDKLGLLVWQDMPNGPGNQASSDVRITDAGAVEFEKELKAMVDGRGNHPCIVVWILFNESWGQYDTARLTEWLKQYDPSRLVNSASGWTDFKTGDIHDRHDYAPIPIAPPQDGVRASVIGECAGPYADLMKTIWPRIDADGLCGVVYTQLTDIESETSSTLLTYDRVLKIDPKIMADANHGGPFAAAKDSPSTATPPNGK